MMQFNPLFLPVNNFVENSENSKLFKLSNSSYLFSDIIKVYVEKDFSKYNLDPSAKGLSINFQDIKGKVFNFMLKDDKLNSNHPFNNEITFLSIGSVKELFEQLKINIEQNSVADQDENLIDIAPDSELITFDKVKGLLEKIISSGSDKTKEEKTGDINDSVVSEILNLINNGIPVVLNLAGENNTLTIELTKISGLEKIKNNTGTFGKTLAGNTDENFQDIKTVKENSDSSQGISEKAFKTNTEVFKADPAGEIMKSGFKITSGNSEQDKINIKPDFVKNNPVSPLTEKHTTQENINYQVQNRTSGNANSEISDLKKAAVYAENFLNENLTEQGEKEGKKTNSTNPVEALKNSKSSHINNPAIQPGIKQNKEQVSEEKIPAKSNYQTEVIPNQKIFKNNGSDLKLNVNDTFKIKVELKETDHKQDIFSQKSFYKEVNSNQNAEISDKKILEDLSSAKNISQKISGNFELQTYEKTVKEIENQNKHITAENKNSEVKVNLKTGVTDNPDLKLADNSKIAENKKEPEKIPVQKNKEVEVNPDKVIDQKQLEIEFEEKTVNKKDIQQNVSEKKEFVSREVVYGIKDQENTHQKENVKPDINVEKTEQKNLKESDVNGNSSQDKQTNSGDPKNQNMFSQYKQENLFTSQLNKGIDNIQTASKADLNEITEHVKKIHSSEIIKEITNLVSDKEQKTVILKLIPENLGKLRIALEIVDKTIHAHIEVENESARNLIQNSSDNLRQSLNQQGLQLNSLNISLAQQQEQKSGKPFNSKKKSSYNQQVQNIEKETQTVSKNLGYNTYEFLA